MRKCLVITKDLALSAMQEGLNKYFSDEARDAFCFEDIEIISTDSEDGKIYSGDVLNYWQVEIPERIIKHKEN